MGQKYKLYTKSLNIQSIIAVKNERELHVISITN